MKRNRNDSQSDYSSDSDDDIYGGSRKKQSKRILNVRKLQANADAILYEKLNKEFFMTSQDEDDNASSYLRVKQNLSYNIKDLERIGAGEVSEEQLNKSETEKYLDGSKKKLESHWGRRKLNIILEEDPIFSSLEIHTTAPPSEHERRYFCVICGDYSKYADTMSGKRTCSNYCYNALQQKGHH